MKGATYESNRRTNQRRVEKSTTKCMTTYRRKSKGISRDQLYTYSRRSGYAHITFNGTYTEKLCEILGRTPTGEEIIMLVDGGFSHFGASCSVYMVTLLDE